MSHTVALSTADWGVSTCLLHKVSFPPHVCISAWQPCAALGPEDKALGTEFPAKQKACLLDGSVKLVAIIWGSSVAVI